MEKTIDNTKKSYYTIIKLKELSKTKGGGGMQWTLEAMRINKGLTQQELADMFDVSPQTIARLEKDSSDIGYQILKKYMDTFHIKFDDIFLGKKYENFVTIN